MNRRLLIRCVLGCVAVCLLGWRLPGMLDGALTSVDQHQGTLSLLRGGGLTIEPGSARGAEAPEERSVTVLGAAGTLSPAERARLIEAASKANPLAEAEAKIAGLKGKKANAASATPTPAPTPQPVIDDSIAAALRALGMDPSKMDLGGVDLEALLAKARESAPDRD